MMSPKNSKKSETIEIRVPHDVKQALKDRAEGEETSVSTIVRRLISDFLDAQQLERPKRRIGNAWLSSAIIAVAGVGLFSTTLASAGEIGVKLKGEITNLNGDTSNVQQVSSELQLQAGEAQTLYFSPTDNRYRLEITAQESNDANYKILIKLFDLDRSESLAIASPTIVVAPGEQAQMDVSGPDGSKYSWLIETQTTSKK